MKYVVTGDWHLRKDRPRCRVDENWLETQYRALGFVFDLSNERGVEVIATGDIFHSPREPHEMVELLDDAIQAAGTAVLMIPGNHDLLYHKFSAGTAYGVSRRLPYVEEVGEEGVLLERGVRALHRLVFARAEDRPHPDAGGQTAEELLAEFPDSKWIFTGDNHQRFHHEKDGRHVVNPGCLLRQNAGEIDYRPAVAIVDLDEETVEWVEIPDGEDLVDDEYLAQAEDRDERIASFVERVRSRGEITLSFRENVRAGLERIPRGVAEIVEEIMEEIR